MVTKVLWLVSPEPSSWVLLRRWRQTRLPFALFGGLAAILVLWARPPWHDPATLLARWALVLLWLALFRLADDLFDREYDRARHPERVLVAAPAVGPFWAAAAFLAVASVLATARLFSPQVAATLVAGGGVLALFYLWSRKLGLSRLAHAHTVLLKYPLFVDLLCGAPAQVDLGLLRILLVTYLAMAVYELSHDAELRQTRFGRASWLCEILGLLGLLASFIFAERWR